MYFSLLPTDAFNEILKLLLLRDVNSLFQALNSDPGKKQLKFLAEYNRLPYSHSLDALVIFKEEYSPKQLIKHCVRLNDLPSFKRLYHRKYRDLITQLLVPYGEKGLIRPRIARHFLEVQIGSDYLDEDNMAIAIYNGLLDHVKVLSEEKVLVSTVFLDQLNGEELMQISNVVSLEQQEGILKYALENEKFSTARHLLDMGVNGVKVKIELKGIPSDILLRLVFRTDLKQDIFLELLRRYDCMALRTMFSTQGVSNVDSDTVVQVLIRLSAGRNLVKQLTWLEQYEHGKEILKPYLLKVWERKTLRACFLTEEGLAKAIKTKDYISAEAFLEMSSGAEVKSLPNDIPDNILKGLTGLQGSSVRVAAIELALSRGLNTLVIQQVQYYYGFTPVIESNKRVELLSLLVKEGIITEWAMTTLLEITDKVTNSLAVTEDIEYL